MLVRVLGPTEVSEADGVITVSPRRERALLAALALHYGRGVPTDLLVDGVFASQTPHRAAHALATLVMRLRTRLGDSTVLTVMGGYRLNDDECSTDAQLFERAVGTGDSLIEALASWRGMPYADLGSWPLAVAERTRLEELHRYAEERLIEQVVAAGVTGESIGELERMVAAEPFREHRWALLIGALHAAGRQADALAAYQRVRRVLAEQLGLEPGQELVAAERAVLLQQSDANAPMVDRHAAFGEMRPQRGPDLVPLPAAVPRLIGRDADLAALRLLVDDERLITLTGPGGVGKTELALAVATGARERFDDGVWWIDLAAIGAGQDVRAVVAGSLGVREQFGVDLTEVVSAALGDRRLLIVVDNCEHVLASVSTLVTGLLRRCANLTVLATSRHRLAVTGERTFIVGALDTRGPDSAALELLRERMGITPRVPPVPVEPLEELCRRLDGIPLGLELAAARCRSMSPTDVLDRLNDRFQLLDAVGASGKTSLLGAVQWSYDLLAEPTRQVFLGLSVFAGTFPLAAAEAVAAVDGDTFNVDDALADLVEHSLVEHGQSGYRLLETVRAFARAELARQHGTDVAHRAHLTWVVDFVTVARLGLRAADELDWVERVDTSWADIRAAFHWALDHDDADAATAIVSHLAIEGFWRRPEVFGWIMAAQERFGAVEHDHRPELLGAAGMAAWAMGEPSRAVTLGRAAVEADRGLIDPLDHLPEYALMVGLGHSGQLDECVEIIHRVLPTTQVPYDRAWWLTVLAVAFAFQDRGSEVRQELLDALRIARSIPNPTLIAYSLMLQPARLDSGDRRGAAFCEEAVEMARSVRNTWVEHAALEVRLLVAVALEEDPAWRIELGLELARERQRRGWILHAWGDLVPVAYAMQSAGHLDTALLLALAARRSPTGDGDAHFLDPLLGALHESIGHDEAERIAEEVDGLDLSALIRIAEGVRLTPAG